MTARTLCRVIVVGFVGVWAAVGLAAPDLYPASLAAGAGGVLLWRWT